MAAELGLRKESVLELPHSEVLLSMVKLGRLAEARILLIRGCPLPQIYLDGRVPSEVSEQELAIIRRQLIDDCEHVHRAIYGPGKLVDTIEALLALRARRTEIVKSTRHSWEADLSAMLAVDGNLKDARVMAAVFRSEMDRGAERGFSGPHERE